jgi:penicillin-insensitive murein endopeptidase
VDPGTPAFAGAGKPRHDTVMGIGRFVLGAGLLAATGIMGLTGNIAWGGPDGDRPSVCYGTAANGRLEGGRRLPYSGENYRAYSLVGFLLGRTYAHSAVRDAMRDAYAELRKSHPELRFVYAEIGWPWGGRFAPHKTHANGTSVDFLVPVRTPDGKVSELPTSAFTMYGYGVHFDAAGKAGSLVLDFEAMGTHLLALEKAARANGIRIQRVIFDVRLQPRLAATRSGALAMGRMTFNTRQAWVPHDEHYHVDFAVPCR